MFGSQTLRSKDLHRNLKKGLRRDSFLEHRNSHVDGCRMDSRLRKRELMSSPVTDGGSFNHPHPMLRRRSSQSLDGIWDFVFDPEAGFRNPREIPWESAGPNLVPFSLKTIKERNR
jgi:hypothetical protein